MTSNSEIVNDLRDRILAGEKPSDAELRTGLTALHAARRERPARVRFLWKLKEWKRYFLNWLRYGKQDAYQRSIRGDFDNK